MTWLFGIQTFGLNSENNQRRQEFLRGYTKSYSPVLNIDNNQLYVVLCFFNLITIQCKGKQ